MSASKQILQKIAQANRGRGLLRKNDSILIALSGGADSTALLWALSKLKRKYRLRLAAAHLDHGLQEAQSLSFSKHAEDISKKFETPFYSKKVRVGTLAKKYKRSLEETGRIERYRFFLEVAAKTGCRKIATAHTLDDQAETLLLRLIRGSGLRGLSGIPYRRREGRAWLIRPLLLCRKKELLAALKENHISFCVDPTNRDDFFTRNRVRSRLLPLLERSFNPKIKESLSGLQAACSEAQDFIEKKAHTAFKNCLAKKISKQKISLRLDRLKPLHRAIQSEVFSLALMATKGDLKQFTHRHLADLESLLDSPESNLRLSLPKVRIHKTRLTLDFFYN